MNRAWTPTNHDWAFIRGGIGFQGVEAINQNENILSFIFNNSIIDLGSLDEIDPPTLPQWAE